MSKKFDEYLFVDDDPSSDKVDTIFLEGLVETTVDSRDAVKVLKDESENVKDYVIEEGSGYEKWKSGKLTQWGKAVHVTKPNIVYGSIFRTNPIGVTFPIKFFDDPVVITSFLDYAFGSVTEISAQGFGYSVLSADNNQRTGSPVSWVAIGRWK